MKARRSSVSLFFAVMLTPLVLGAQSEAPTDPRLQNDLESARACMTAASRSGGHIRAAAMAQCAQQLPPTLASLRASFAASTAAAYASAAAPAPAIRWAIRCYRDASSASGAELSARLRRQCAALVREHFRSVAWIRNDDPHCDWRANETIVGERDEAQSDVVRVERVEWTAVRAASTTLTGYCERAPRPDSPPPQVALNVTLAAATRYRIGQSIVLAQD